MSDLGAELRSIYEQHGRLTPALVVDEARPKGHPLHAIVFDRPPKQAAEAYYRNRAQGLIQSVKISYRKEEDGPPQEIRAYTAVRRAEATDNGGFEYEPTEEAVRNDDTLAAVLAEMERDWKQLKARYAGFEGFAEMVRSDALVAT